MNDFFRLTKNLPPHPLTVKAVKHALKKDVAIDIGCGAMRDTKFLLRTFTEVFAVDKEYFPHKDNNRLYYCEQDLTHFLFPYGADFINAQYVLPFLKGKDFKLVWKNLRESLAPGAIFCGNFFGWEDGWSNNHKMTFLTKKQVKGLFKGMGIIEFKEIKKDGVLADGTPHKWHVFEIIARA